jgi:hypothetical protein
MEQALVLVENLQFSGVQGVLHAVFLCFDLRIRSGNMVTLGLHIRF